MNIYDDILAAFHGNKRLTSEEVAQILGVEQKTVSYRIAKLTMAGRLVTVDFKKIIKGKRGHKVAIFSLPEKVIKDPVEYLAESGGWV